MLPIGENREVKDEGDGRSEHKGRREHMDVRRTCGENTEELKKKGAGSRKN
jgi:hypothetical protein